MQSFLGHEHFVTSAAFSPDGKRLVTGSVDESVKVWDTASGALLQTLEGHTGGVTAVAFSPDGRYFASTGADYFIKLWDAPNAELLCIFFAVENGKKWISFTPSGPFSGNETGLPLLHYVKAGKAIPLKNINHRN